MKNIILVEAEIWTMIRTDKGNAVLIKPIESKRAVPIFIDPLEAQSILIGLGNIDLPRPLTHDLCMSIFNEMHVDIERVEITDLTDETFYARIIARQGNKKCVFDSRPSDAIAIAIRAGCSVYIAEYIVDEASIPTSLVGEGEKMSKKKPVLEELKRTLAGAIEKENYEEAAKLRDRIREMEENDRPLEKAFDKEFKQEIIDTGEDVFSIFRDIIEEDDTQDEDQ